MAGRSRSTFGKRQKEAKRQEKRQEKAARRDQRKLDKQSSISSVSSDNEDQAAFPGDAKLQEDESEPVTDLSS